MSLQWELDRQVPADTAAVANGVLRADSVYRTIGDQFEELMPDEGRFAHLYKPTGRGAIPPLLCALVTMFQALEKLPDRVAASYTATRLDWKYALHLPLSYPGFHWTDLLAFRKRMMAHDDERLFFELMLQKLRDLGMIKRRGKLRTDSTHIIGVVERLSQLELTTESIRVAVESILKRDPSWAESVLPPAFLESYEERHSEYGLSDTKVKDKLKKAGLDAEWLLNQLQQSAPDALRALEEIKILRQVIDQQYPDGPDQPPTGKRPAGKDAIESPHEPEARLGVKRKKTWIGYKSQITETCDADLPHLIVDVAATSALDNDGPQLAAIQDRLTEWGIVPEKQFVDQGYSSAANIVQSAERGITLMGIPLEDTQSPQGFHQADFHVDEAAHVATCPAGHPSNVWSEKKDPQGGPCRVEVRFDGNTCRKCPYFGQCTTSRQGRSLTLHPHRAVLAKRRAEAKTEEFRQEMHLRAGIEATISQLVRRLGVRRARYRGRRKLQLQFYFAGAALNLIRTVQWMASAAEA